MIGKVGTYNLEKVHKNGYPKKHQGWGNVDMPSGRVFNFADSEDDYFAVMEKNK